MTDALVAVLGAGSHEGPPRRLDPVLARLDRGGISAGRERERAAVVALMAAGRLRLTGARSIGSPVRRVARAPWRRLFMR